MELYYCTNCNVVYLFKVDNIISTELRCRACGRVGYLKQFKIQDTAKGNKIEC